MNVHELEFFLVEAPSADEAPAARSLLARVATESGAEGWGEAGAHWRTAELAARRDTVLSVLAGRSMFNVEELTRLDVLRDPRIRSAVEMACWDLIGRAAGQPLCRLFGGQYRERVPLAVGLPCRQDANLGHLARELTEQYTALMATENVELRFTADSIVRLAEIATVINERTENIGARRLHTVMERLLETVSFEATDRSGSSISIDADYVNEHLNALVKDEDLSRYIL